MVKKKKEFYFSKWGYTRKDFQKWGRKGGRPAKYVSPAERQKTYRRKKAQARLENGEVVGILNMTTGKVNKYRSNAERQKDYRERKKIKNYAVVIK